MTVGSRIVCMLAVPITLKSHSRRAVSTCSLSDWKDVAQKSLVSREFLLSLMLFGIFLNDLDGGRQSTPLKMPDDTKLLEAAET